MPKLPRPCLACGTPTTNGARCPQHTPTYGHAWQRIRQAARQAHPHCAVPGCTNTTNLEVDHILPGRLDLGVQVLCAHHHHLKTMGQRT